MADSTHEVVLEAQPNGIWEAHIPAIPTLHGVGETSNQALASLDTAFDAWQKEQREINVIPLEERGAIWRKVSHSLHSLYKSLPEPAPGDFSVDNNCCTSCGVPQMVAPDLIGWTEEPFVSCYWKKQPETPQEFEQAFNIFQGQELGCHRYAGSNRAIQARIGIENCDHAGVTFPGSTMWGSRAKSPKPEAHTSFLKRLWQKLFKRY